MSSVLWHDLECGGYFEDLPLWRELAARRGGPVLDIGAGTGRVALDLAGRGFEVIAVDVEEDLLAALRERAGSRPVQTVCADARELALGRRFPLALVPMQTVQLLGGAQGRARFLRAVRKHLADGGLLAMALADALDSFDSEIDVPPTPDMREVGGVIYASRPLAVVDEGDRAAIHRLREIVSPAGERTVSDDVVRLDRCDRGTLEAEARAAGGWRVLPGRRVDQTDEYVGSAVVLLEAC